MVLVERHLVAADAVDLDDQAAVGDLGLEPVAQVEREPSASKPGPRLAQVAGTGTNTARSRTGSSGHVSRPLSAAASRSASPRPG